MPSRQRGDQPQNHSNRCFWKGPNLYNQCPRCSNSKRSTSALCRVCRIESRRIKVSRRTIYVDGEPCRLIPLTKSQVAIVDVRNFKRISKHYWYAVYDPHTGGYYARRRSNNKVGFISMHQEITKCFNKLVDHKNHNTLDQRESNLRICTNQKNSFNSKKQKK